MSAMGTASCQMVQRAVALATLMGAPTAALVAAAGVSPATLADPDGRLPLDQLFLLFDEIVRHTGDEAFGIRLAEASRAVPDNVLGLAVHSSPTLGEALRRCARYVRIVNDAAVVELVIAGDDVRLQFRVDRVGGAHRIGPQVALGMMVLLGRQTMAPFAIAQAAFRQPRPGPAALAAFERVFGAAVVFGAPIDEVIAPRRVLDAPLPKADPALCAHLDRHLDVLLERTQPADLRARVSRLLADRLSGGPPDVETVAAHLHMSPRSLQRRLRDAGTSFQGLLDTLRRDLALRYLDQGLSLTEVAFLVGFTVPSNFHRAFKRWTGITPAEARRRRPGDARA